MKYIKKKKIYSKKNTLFGYSVFKSSKMISSKAWAWLEQNAINTLMSNLLRVYGAISRI